MELGKVSRTGKKSSTLHLFCCFGYVTVNKPHALVLLQCTRISQLSTQQPYLVLLISTSLPELGAGVEMPGMCLALWVSRNSANPEGLIPPEQNRDPTLTQWSLKSPTITAGAKDLAGFMEQPV